MKTKPMVKVRPRERDVRERWGRERDCMVSTDPVLLGIAAMLQTILWSNQAKQ